MLAVAERTLQVSQGGIAPQPRVAEEHEEVDDAVARARKLSKLTKIEVDSDDDSFIDDSEAGPSAARGMTSSDEEYVEEEDSDGSED